MEAAIRAYLDCVDQLGVARSRPWPDGAPPEPSAWATLREVFAFDPRDWSLTAKDAVLYGIVLGWSASALAEVAERHGWSERFRARLTALHADFMALRARLPEPGATAADPWKALAEIADMKGPLTAWHAGEAIHIAQAVLARGPRAGETPE